MEKQELLANPPGGVANGLAKSEDNDLDELDFDLGSNDEKPGTMEELVQALRESGFFGAWKDRTDIGDTLEYARQLRERASQRQHE